MHTFTLKVAFKIGAYVCRLADPDKNLYIIIAYIADGKYVLYQIRGIEGVLTLYDFEIVSYNERLAIEN